MMINGIRYKTDSVFLFNHYLNIYFNYVLFNYERLFPLGDGCFIICI